MVSPNSSADAIRISEFFTKRTGIVQGIVERRTDQVLPTFLVESAVKSRHFSGTIGRDNQSDADAERSPQGAIFVPEETLTLPGCFPMRRSASAKKKMNG